MYKGNIYEFIDKINIWLRDNPKFNIQKIEYKNQGVSFWNGHRLWYYSIRDDEDFEKNLYETINKIINYK